MNSTIFYVENIAKLCPYLQRNAKNTACLFLLIASAVRLTGQHNIPPNASRSRVIALVHLTGSGKAGDPVRPEFAPIAGIRDKAGILAWTFQLTDDKKMAIVHYVSVNQVAMQSILADKRPEIRVFEVGKHTREEIEGEMRKYKKDFNLETLILPGF